MTTPLANAAAIRAGNYSLRAYGAFYAPAAIATGTVSLVPGVPRDLLGVTYVTGAYTDVERGMTVGIYTPGGLLKGFTHVAYSSIAIAANVLPIRELSTATIDVAVNDIFKIFPDWRVHDKLVAATSIAPDAFAPDYLDYVDQGTNPDPVCNSGGHVAAWVDGYGTSTVTTYATVLMTGSASYVVDPDSSGAHAHLWTLPTGVAFAPGSANTDADPTLRANGVTGGNSGEYIIRHDFTDSDNGKTRRQHIIVEVYDASRLPTQVLITSYNGALDSGFSYSLQLLSGSADLLSIPDGCWCILFTDEFVANTRQAFRNAAPGRQNVIGVGVVIRDTESGDSSGYNKIVFDVISPLARLKQLTSYSKAMLDGVLAEWDNLKTLGVKRALIQILEYYTMLTEAGVDLIFDSAFIDYRYPAFYLQRSDFVGQLTELASGVDARITCDRSGRIDIHTAPPYIKLADCAAVAKSWRFVPGDILSWEFTREQVDNVELLKSSGFTGGASSNQPIFALYPGAAPGEGVNTPTKARLIVAADDGTDIRERTGRYGAEADGTYHDANGVLWRATTLKLKLRGVYNFFDFQKQFADFTTTLKLPRNLDLTAILFYLTAISVTDDATGSPITNATFEMATHASKGDLYVSPSSSSTTPAFAPLPAFRPGSTVGVPLDWGSGNLGFISSDGYLYYTTSFTAATPVWTRLGLSMSGTPQDFVPNPFCPRYLKTGNNIEFWVVTTTDIYKVTWNPDSPGSATVTSQYTFPTPNPDSAVIETERGFPGVVGVARVFSTIATDYDGTTDGATWSIHTNIDLDGFSNPVALYVSPRVSGKIITATTVISTSGAVIGKVSANNGSTFASIASPVMTGFGSIGGLHIPFNNNAAETIAYYGSLTSGGTRHVYMANGVVKTDISPEADYWVDAPTSIDTCPINRNYLVVCAVQTTNLHVWAATDGQTLNIPIDMTNTYHGVRYAGNDINHFYLYGASGHIAAGSISGSVEDRMGNLSSFSPGAVLRVFGW